MKIREPFKCSLCGWVDNRKKAYPYDDINEYFLHAKEIWCPRNICKEKYGRNIPKGHVCRQWYDYGGWCTLEAKPKVLNFEDGKAILGAKNILDEAIDMYCADGHEDELKDANIVRHVTYFGSCGELVTVAID